MSSVPLNRHGIPYVPPPPVPRRCMNKTTKQPKKTFRYRMLAEQYIARCIVPAKRPYFDVYQCEVCHLYHLTHKREQ